MISFADSTNPALIPAPAFTHVAAYVNGRYKWPLDQLRRFPAHIEISVTPDPLVAAVARVQDDELFDARPENFPPFLLEREHQGHHDATSYTSILGPEGFGIAAVVAALAAARIDLWRARFWVAWWWGRPFPPTAAEVLAEIRALTGLSLPVGVLWACQWQNGQNYDSSVLYGRDDFTR